jgi:hypothetical protein
MISSLLRCLLSAPLCAAAVAVAPADATSAPAAKPNIVVIVADDLGYGEPGCYGGRDIPTPHLDAAWQDGVSLLHVSAFRCGRPLPFRRRVRQCIRKPAERAPNRPIPIVARRKSRRTGAACRHSEKSPDAGAR